MLVLTVTDDFFDYDALLNNMCRDLSGQVKVNHIFSCNGDDLLAMALAMQRSNLLEHPALTHIASKVRSRRFNCLVEGKGVEVHWIEQ